MKATGILRRWRWLLFVVVALATAWAGLDPKGYRFRNEVTLTPDGAGLTFARFGRAHTDPVFAIPQSGAAGRPGFSISVVFEPHEVPDGEFPVVASLHSGWDDTQLILGLWRQHLIVMWGNDFAHRRLLPRVSADLSAIPDRPVVASLVASDDGAMLYVNGQPVDANPRMLFAPPVGPEATRLVLGNSIDASRPFSGMIQLIVLNRGSLAAPLHIPGNLPPLYLRALTGPVEFYPGDGAMRRDLLFNFFGFMPLGFALAWLLSTVRRRPAITITLVAALALASSLSIELAQAWMPTRDSSLRDLLLNVGGAATGAWLAALRESLPSGRERRRA